MAVKVLDSSGQSVELDDHQANMLFEAMVGGSDPRISACIECRSAVVATEPFNTLLDDLSILHPDQTEIIGNLIDLVESSEAVHIYIMEDNDCVHVLWRDPIAAEWSEVTGEKRLHH